MPKVYTLRGRVDLDWSLSVGLRGMGGMTVHRRTFLKASAAAAAGGLAAPAVGTLTSAAVAAPQLDRVLARGMSLPWGIAFLPTGNALVTERASGDVYRVASSGGKTLVGTVDEAVDFGEGGLLGPAVAPTFATDSWVYFYVTTSSDNRIIRKQYDGNSLSTSEEVLLSGIARTNNGSMNHHGGRLAFGPDAKLYATTGDAGNGQRAQDDNSPNGKILRINPDGTVPADNPSPGNPMWSKGHRNVQGIAWDDSGQLWATEFGANDRDELNRIVKGHNYGWPVVEGGDGPGGPFHDPFVTWSPTSTCSPSGLAIVNGTAWVGALNGDCLWSVKLEGRNAGRKVRHFHNRFGRIRAVERVAGTDRLWITTSNGSRDKVIRIEV